MNELAPRDYVYAHRNNRRSQMQLRQRAIVIALLLISALISFLLPIYIAHLPAAGG
jgi:hypothetical protein